MGTWGVGPFDNDMALDWVWELEEARDWSVVRGALEPAADRSAEYLDSSVGEMAVAAAEVVAASRGRGIEALPQEVTAFVASRGVAPEDIVLLAVRAVEGVMLEHSELRWLWSDSRAADGWLASMRALRARLGR